MSGVREGPNPLRPYRVPTANVSTSINGSSNTSASTASNGLPKSAQSTRFESAREVLSDLDYSEYLAAGSPSLLELVKNSLDQGLWKYTSVFLAQPFEVAKVALQVQDAGSVTGREEEKEKLRSHAEYDVRNPNISV